MRTRLLLSVAAAVAIVGAGWLSLARVGGFSARAEPSRAEQVVSRAVRHWAVPPDARDVRNPVTFSEEVWADARAHFADHCATCHGNDGSGNTEIGRNLYPKAPDMRQPDTQRLTDGELYWVIENGVRLTGMPAWGEGKGDDTDTWKLVHFIRRLQDLTPDQLAEMQALNPKTPDELKEEQEDQRFLKGEKTETPPSRHAHQHDKEKS